MSNERWTMSAIKKGTYILAAVLFAIALFTNPCFAQKCKGDCGGKYHGKKPTEEELKKILADHAKWVKEVLEPAFEEGIDLDKLPQAGRVNLCGADLSKANLANANLTWANLEGAALQEVNLDGANLLGVNLRNVNLRGAKLKVASLSGADLSRANLYDTDLSEAGGFGYVNLNGANLESANLSGKSLGFVNLSKANLKNANLNGADLVYVNLNGAGLENVDMSGAKLVWVNMDSVRFELKPGALPLIPSIALIKNLSTMWYKNSPHSLVELREAFKKAGLRQQEREITYAIEHTRRQKQIRGEEGVGGLVKGFLKFIPFELTCDYGMSPGRPLLILLGFIFALGFPYWFALNNPQGQGGIWQYWEKDRPLKEKGQGEAVRLCVSGWRRIWYAFYFSMLSAFHIGWRELNVGQWIVRLQGDEFTLSATKWVRTVSGFQSLISVHLMALSVLSYFGRPFEG